MRLSDIRGERAIEVIAELIDPVANIAGDNDLAELMRREKLPEGADPKAAAIKRLKAALPKLLKNHKSDFVAILAALEGVEREKFEKELSLPKLISGLLELLNDDDFKTLFFSAQSGKASGSV